jgi:hypothetical protein
MLGSTANNLYQHWIIEYPSVPADLHQEHNTFSRAGLWTMPRAPSCGLSPEFFCGSVGSDGFKVVTYKGHRRQTLNLPHSVLCIIFPSEMVVSNRLVGAVIWLLPSCMVALGLSWNTTEYMFVFGDSYTNDGYNVTVGITSPDPGYVNITLAF